MLKKEFYKVLGETTAQELTENAPKMGEIWSEFDNLAKHYGKHTIEVLLYGVYKLGEMRGARQDEKN